MLAGSFSLAAQGYAEKIRQHRQDYFEKLKDRVDFGPGDQKVRYINYYEPDTAFVVEADFVIKSKQKEIEFITSTGMKAKYLVFGELHFKVGDKNCILQVYRPSVLSPLTKNILFIPFKDLTSGNYTYGGGRYLDLRMDEVKGEKLRLDFNKAYNPLCAYEDGFSCPIPPKENHLKVKIEAGEKNFH